MTQPTRPEIDFPGDQPPTELVLEDITVGDGPEAAAGHTVRAHYVGVAFRTLLVEDHGLTDGILAERDRNRTRSLACA